MSELLSEDKPLSRACLLCTNTDSGFRQSLCLVAVPGLHIAHILRGIPKCDVQKAATEDTEDGETMVVNVEEGEFLIERLREWIEAHKAYNAAHPDRKGIKRYTAEIC